MAQSGTNQARESSVAPEATVANTTAQPSADDANATTRVTGKSPLLYRDKPIFGLDVGYGSVKVMQIDRDKQGWNATGYGVASFDPKSIQDGVVVEPSTLAHTVRGLLEGQAVGHIATRRTAMSIPAARTFIRSATLPLVAAEDMQNAVRLEIEQYIPVPMHELYTDYSIIRQSDKDVQLLVAAVPKKIADSYLAITDALGIEVIALEPSLTAVSRLFAELDHAVNLPTVLVDFGAISSDVIMYDGGVITAGTVPGGGETLTALIAKRLHITAQESHFIKSRYGIGPGIKKREILAAVRPQLEQIVEEIRRVMRYFEEHSGGKTIGQIVTTGGGANLVGLNDYLTAALRAPARSFGPWSKVRFTTPSAPNNAEKPIYTTVAGLALLEPKEIFA